jgi:ADP-ribose pyrophosphatase
VWFARGLAAGQARPDEGEFVEVVTATIPEVLEWCRQGLVTDSKTVVAALWLQNVASGSWKLDWRT